MTTKPIDNLIKEFNTQNKQGPTNVSIKRII